MELSKGELFSGNPVLMIFSQYQKSAQSSSFISDLLSHVEKSLVKQVSW